MSLESIQEVLDGSKKAYDLWLVLNAGYSGSSFKLFKPDSIFSKQIEKTNFTGGEINLGLNFWCARVLHSTFLAGTTIGIKHKNNFDDLEESNREDIYQEFDTTTKTQRLIRSPTTVYKGKYKESIVYPWNIDLYFVPHGLKNVGFLLYGTTDIVSDELPKTKLGVGVYFLKKQNAFNPIAGITFDYSDVFNNDRSDDTKGSLNKFKVALTTRITIVNNQKRS